ncbi:MAG TPA: DUF1292 domain-containing protein [Clostridia bacterium]|nr:DUF1292 domain-containing protein [Clostridia bacterium]
MDQERLVTLTAPDGSVYQFRLGSVLDFEDCLYAVLIELEKDGNGEEQLLITRWSTDDNGEQRFEVVSEERVINAVFERYVAESIGEAISENDPEA